MNGVVSEERFPHVEKLLHPQERERSIEQDESYSLLIYSVSVSPSGESRGILCLHILLCLVLLGLQVKVHTTQKLAVLEEGAG